MQHIINRLILISGAWDATGQSDRALEAQFDRTLTELANAANTDQEGAMTLLLEDLEVSHASA